LNDEAGLDPVKRRPVVKAGACQLDERGRMLRRILRIERKDDVALIS
jgi:hypothetical protein